MSRYTELMKKNELSLEEKDEFFKLLLEEFDREERRINKLPIDETMRHESLWNVISAHREFFENYISEKPDNDAVFNKLSDAQFGCIKRMMAEYKFEEDQNEDQNDLKPKDIYADEKTRKLLDLKEYSEKTGVPDEEISNASRELKMQKSDYKYSVAGDKTITEEQRKALYMFHHWMRKHNASVSAKWAGFGYKGSTADFSERFMRLPARVQLKALYLVETDNRKHPMEDVDNVVSQDYVPNYDNLKKKMTSSFFFVRKYMNRSRYLWDKLEQAANIANNDQTVKKLKEFTDKKQTNPETDASDFFIQNTPEGIYNKFLAEKQKASLEANDNRLDKAARKQKAKEYELLQASASDVAVIMKSALNIAEATKNDPDGNEKFSPENKQKIQESLADIVNAQKRLKKKKHVLEGYKHYFFNQTNDMAGYTASASGFGTNFYNVLTGEDAYRQISGAVSLATLPSSVMNFVNDIRTLYSDKDKWEKTEAVFDMAANAGMGGSRAIGIYSLYDKAGTAVNNVAKGLCTGALGIWTLINAAKTHSSRKKSNKADDLNKSFQTLKERLEKNIKNEYNKLNAEDINSLNDMKQKTLWNTLEKASKLIKNDKKREYYSNLRKLGASAIGLLGNVAGYAPSTLATGIVKTAGGGGSALFCLLNNGLDNVAARDRNHEYIDTEYPINNAQRVIAIRNYKKQLEKCQKGSKQWKEINDILSSKEKLDNRIRNMKAGNRMHAHQEGLRNSIYQQYLKAIAEEAFKDDEIKDTKAAEYEKSSRKLVRGMAELLNLKNPNKKEEERSDNKKKNDEGKKKEDNEERRSKSASSSKVK